MGKPLKTYDLNKVHLVIGGFRIGGYAEDGNVEFESAKDLYEETHGADGEVTVSRNASKALYCNLTVLETSRSYRDLAALMQTQLDQDEIEGVDFLLQDSINGDKISDQHVVFMKRPDVKKNRVVTERVFRLLLPNGAEDMVFGGKIKR